MTRKNSRLNEHQPLDIETLSVQLEADPPPPLIRKRLETREERDARINAEFGRQRRRNDRRTDERVAMAIDWDTCCVPGCGADLGAHWRNHPERDGRRKDPGQSLPMCTRHETIVYEQVSPFIAAKDPDYYEIRKRLALQEVDKQIENHRLWELAEESNGSEVGQIYFVRINDLVKVGWSLKLRSRLKAYGASAVVLCHYPASRTDETLLHRQLRPFLAKGREWYQDCKLIEDVVAGIVKQHGEPTILPFWTEPKPDVVATKRYSA